MRPRDLKAAAAAVVLLIVGVAGAFAFGVWVWHRHDADQAALHRDRSYRYGLTVDPYSLAGDDVRSVYNSCQKQLAGRHPFPDFSAEKAAAGCLDRWQQVMR